MNIIIIETILNVGQILCWDRFGSVNWYDI